MPLAMGFVCLWNRLKASEAVSDCIILKNILVSNFYLLTVYDDITQIPAELFMYLHLF